MAWTKHYASKLTNAVPACPDSRFPVCRTRGVTAQDYSESEWYQQICSGESTLADAIMDRISYDSYKINIESIDPSKDLSMREVYGLDPAQAE